MDEKSNLIQMPMTFTTKVKNREEKTIILDERREIAMEKESFVTHQDLKNLEKQTDLKFENVTAKIDHSYSMISQKLDHIEKNIPNEIKLALSDQEKESQKEARETRRFLVGTVLIGVVGIVISLISLFT